MNEIEAILCKLSKCNRSGLYLGRGERTLSARQYARLENILQKRIGGQPLQYLLGDTEFFGLKFKVRPGVLIPRPETEVLVEEAIKQISLNKLSCPRIADIGTGSGNIAIALAKNVFSCQMHAVDISETCISVAKSNARLNRVARKITFHRSDLFSCFAGTNIKFDLIVSNPPYVSDKEYENLPCDVLCEPSSALLAGRDGLGFYSRLEKECRVYLKSAGTLIFEIGETQAKGIRKIFSDTDIWQGVEFVRDLNAKDRVAVIRRSEI